MSSNATNLARLLERQKTDILERWKRNVRAEIPAAQGLSDSDLLTSMPGVLCDIALALSAGNPARSQAENPREHALQRARLPLYSLNYVVREYSLLRNVIFDVVTEGTKSPSLDALRIILKYVDLATSQATSHYMDLHDKDLRESEERFGLLVANVKDYAIYMLDEEGYIVSWNRGAEYIKGYREEEVLGKHFSLFYIEDDVRDGKPETNLLTAARLGRFEDEGLRVRSDGSTFLANVIITAVRDDEGKLRGFAKVTRDVTEHHLMQAELQKRADKLADANQRKDEFLAMLSHELRNPLASIVMASQVLRQNSVATQDVERAQNIIQRQGKHLARLVDDLLDVSRITQGKIILRREPITLKNLVEAVSETVQPFVEEQGQHLNVGLPDTEVWLDADMVRLTQVLSNLIHNSAKFSDPGSSIRVSALVAGGVVNIRVADEGSGISGDLLPRIFDVFTQGRPSRGDIVSGLGLGLALVRRLVDMHGGVVTAHSDGPGKGSDFVVRLPVLQVEMSRGEAAEQASARASAVPKKILVVDDNIDAADTLAMLLQSCDHSVEVVHSGEAALHAAAKVRPHIVLLDIGLPDIDGYEVARRLRARPEHQKTKLVAISGYGQEEDRRRSRSAGIDEHLTKPADFHLLQRVINYSSNAG
jgi:PAS domain S-box-containing protein